jgi:iron complex transport system substrate-binding protein
VRAVPFVVAAIAALAAPAWSTIVPPQAAAARAQTVSSVTKGDFPKTIVDPLGHARTLRAPPRRIASLVLSADEILLELVPVDRIAGLTYLIDDVATTPSAPLAPRGAARLTEQDPESLLAARPDLVVVAGYTRAETIALLGDVGVPVVGSGAHDSLERVLVAIATLGDAVGEEARAADLVASLRARIELVRERAKSRPPRRVLLWEGGYTYGAGSLQDDLIRIAGGVNAAAEAGLRGPCAVSEETALRLAPDAIVVPVESDAVRLRAPELVGGDPAWSRVEAAQRKRVYGVPRAWIGSVSHHAVRALEAIDTVLEDLAR